MLNLVRLFTRLTARLFSPRRLNYVEARTALETDDVPARRQLARANDTAPEMLYYMARDPVDEVRIAVAANPATPIQAAPLLAADENTEVRAELARRIARLLPDLQKQEATQLAETAMTVLTRLAEDAAPRVRQIVARELCESPLIPRDMALKLARDGDIMVAAPILEYSPLLSDHDLLEIIATAKLEGVLPAIARRSGLDETVSDAVAASLEIPAIAALVANPSAKIRQETLDQIVDQARSVEALHEPLVMRRDLSARAVSRLSDFVAASLLDRLARVHGLDEATERQLRTRARERLAEDMTQPGEESDTLSQLDADFKAGNLTPDALADLIDGADIRLVGQGLALCAGMPPDLARRILQSGNAKGITALCWKAGLPMRLAVKTQTKVARLPYSEIVPSQDGIHYPLTTDEMRWQLEYYGAET